MQKLALTKGFLAYLAAFEITPTTHKSGTFQHGLDQCSINSMQKLPSNSEEKINMFIVGGKKHI